MSLQTFEAAPAAKSTRLISFERAEVQSHGYGNDPVLIVSGQAPCLNMQIALQPLIFIRCPEYWGIEVVGTLPGGICLDAVKPFKVTLPLRGNIGSKGIEVIGSNKTEKIDLKGGCQSGATQPTQ